jgi:hypothetical protein
MIDEVMRKVDMLRSATEERHFAEVEAGMRWGRRWRAAMSAELDANLLFE